MHPVNMNATTISAILAAARSAADQSEVFTGVRLDGQTLVCGAKNSGAPAEYRMWIEEDRPWVALVTADRWLSGSIELNLIHTGDKMEELLEEELAEQGCDHRVGKIEHFRSNPPEKLYTFRVPVPIRPNDEAGTAQNVCAYLLAIEACFRELGDMSAGKADN